MKMSVASVAVCALTTLAGCGAKTPVPPLSSPTAVITSASPSASSTPAFAEPVRVGDKLVFTDPEYGYSVSFDPDYWFNSNAEVMEASMVEAEQVAKRKIPEASFRFRLFLRQPQESEVTSSMAAIVEAVSPLAGSISNKQYAQSGRAQVEKTLKGKFTKPLEKTTVQGREMYINEYQLTIPNVEKPLDVVNYSFYDAKARRAYNFTYSYTGATAEEDRKAFQAVLETIKLR